MELGGLQVLGIPTGRSLATMQVAYEAWRRKTATPRDHNAGEPQPPITPPAASPHGRERFLELQSEALELGSPKGKVLRCVTEDEVVALIEEANAEHAREDQARVILEG